MTLGTILCEFVTASWGEIKEKEKKVITFALGNTAINTTLRQNLLEMDFNLCPFLTCQPCKDCILTLKLREKVVAETHLHLIVFTLRFEQIVVR